MKGQADHLPALSFLPMHEGRTIEMSIFRWLYRKPRVPSSKKGGNKVLELIAVVLIVLWILGFVTANTMGGFIHILLVIAVVMILVRLIQGRRIL